MKRHLYLIKSDQSEKIIKICEGVDIFYRASISLISDEELELHSDLVFAYIFGALDNYTRIHKLEIDETVAVFRRYLMKYWNMDTATADRKISTVLQMIKEDEGWLFMQEGGRGLKIWSENDRTQMVTTLLFRMLGIGRNRLHGRQR